MIGGLAETLESLMDGTSRGTRLSMGDRQELRYRIRL